MKGKNIILLGVGVSAIAASLKMVFDFGAKMGIATVLSNLSSEDISEIVSKEKGGWYKDISKITEIVKERKNK